MARQMSFYVGNMLSSKECFVLDTTGIPCGQRTLTQDPAPICRAHARQLVSRLTFALRTDSLVGP